MINAIILGFASASITCFLYYIAGKPYTHEGKVYLSEEGQILDFLGVWVAENFGAPCLVCVNTWIAIAIACLALIAGASTFFEAILSIGFAFIALKLYQKLAID